MEWHSASDQAGGQPNVTRVEAPEKDGKITKCMTKEDSKEAIASEILKRFGRVDILPIYQGPLFDILGYSSNIKAM